MTVSPAGSMTPAEMKAFRRLQTKFEACQLAKKLYTSKSNKSNKPKLMDPACLAIHAAKTVKWPTDMEDETHEMRALEFMQQ